VLRGIEGGRMKKTYANLAQLHGIEWRGRRYNRGNPNAADIPNQAINHAASAVEAAAAIAVTATATIPQLGFIHEDPGQSFVLDIADLFRDQVTIPAAFSAAAIYEKNRNEDNIERLTRRKTGSLLRKEKVVDRMIERIKQLFEIEKSSNTEQTDANDGSSHA
jgi:CRISPR-associated protein Cas1